MPKWAWDKEYEIDFGARGGRKIYDMWDDEVHVVQRQLGTDYTVYGGMDHGRANPTVLLWAAVFAPRPPWYTPDLHFFREYYERDRAVAEHARAIRAMQPDEWTEPQPRTIFIDPSTNRREENSRRTVRQEYARYGVRTTPADNGKEAGRQAVYGYLLATLARWSLTQRRVHDYWDPATPWKRIREIAGHPAATFSPEVIEGVREMRDLRFKKWSAELGDRDPKEDEEDKDDHAPDCVRYLLISKPTYVRSASLVEDTTAVRLQRRKLERRHLNAEREGEDEDLATINLGSR